jgi:hypothetical protein
MFIIIGPLRFIGRNVVTETGMNPLVFWSRFCAHNSHRKHCLNFVTCDSYNRRVSTE